MDIGRAHEWRIPTGGGHEGLAGVPIVAVLDDMPAFRRGIATALIGAGFEAVEAAGRNPPAAARPLSAVVVGMDIATEPWPGQSDLALIAVLPRMGPNEIGAALAAGATSIVDRWTSLDEVVLAVQLALAGWSILPRRVVPHLTSGLAASRLALEDRRILTALASGVTIANLSEAHHISERELYRRLRILYEKLGVRNRLEAVATFTLTATPRGDTILSDQPLAAGPDTGRGRRVYLGRDPAAVRHESDQRRSWTRS